VQRKCNGPDVRGVSADEKRWQLRLARSSSIPAWLKPTPRAPRCIFFTSEIALQRKGIPAGARPESRLPTARQWYAILLAELGRDAEALTHGREAVALDPLSGTMRQALGLVHYYG
jgi:hypothetical protein